MSIGADVVPQDHFYPRAVSGTAAAAMKEESEKIEKIDRVIALVKEFHTVRATFTLDYVRAFLAVARDPGKGPTHYGKTLGIKQERASKILLDLAGYSRNSSDRLDLLKYEVDPSDHRARCYFLSGTGRELKERALAWLSFNE